MEVYDNDRGGISYSSQWHKNNSPKVYHKEDEIINFFKYEFQLWYINVFLQVKKIMNSVFQSLRAEFVADESYTGSEILGIILNVIKVGPKKCLSDVSWVFMFNIFSLIPFLV